MQEAIDTELVEQRPVLGQLAALEVVHQADRREHQGVAGEVVDVGLVLEALDDPVAIGRAFPARLLCRLVLRQAHRGAPVTRVVSYLGRFEIEQVALIELQRPQAPRQVCGGPRGNQVVAPRMALHQGF